MEMINGKLKIRRKKILSWSPFSILIAFPKGDVI
jgi:hypothetical protein